MSELFWRQSRIFLSKESSKIFAVIGFSLECVAQDCRNLRKASNPFSAIAPRIAGMLQRFTDHPATVNETYFEHMRTAFGFGGAMLLGGLACLVHGLFPWLFLTHRSDTIRALHRRMVSHRVVPSVSSSDARIIAAE